MADHVATMMNGKFSGRRSLLGLMRATKILLITPLIRFYVPHGLVVDRVYQVFEWQSGDCFRSFCDTIIAHRQAADFDPSQAVVGEMYKLIGNSAYGRTLMQTEKFQTTRYGDNKVYGKIVRGNAFRDAEIIADNFHDIHKTVRLI